MTKDKPMISLTLADDIDTIKSLIETCVIALGNKEGSDYEARKIAETLYFVVLPLLSSLQEKI